MKTDTVTKLRRPASADQLPPDDPLTKILREGAQKLIAQAVEAELQTFLELHAHKRTEDGLKAVVRNGYLPERDFQTGIGSMPVKIPKVRDRSGSGIKFNSELVPPYLRRTWNGPTLTDTVFLGTRRIGCYGKQTNVYQGVQGKSGSIVARLE